MGWCDALTSFYKKEKKREKALKLEVNVGNFGKNKFLQLFCYCHCIVMVKSCKTGYNLAPKSKFSHQIHDNTHIVYILCTAKKKKACFYKKKF